VCVALTMPPRIERQTSVCNSNNKTDNQNDYNNDDDGHRTAHRQPIDACVSATTWLVEAITRPPNR